MLFYSLNQDLKLDKIVSQIVQLVHSCDSPQSKVLTISLQEISDYAGDSPIPKIEYKCEG